MMNLEKSKFTAKLKLLGLLVVVLLGAAVVFVLSWFNPNGFNPSKTNQSSLATVQLAVLEQSQTFQRLRVVEFMGKTFWVIRHTPTGQRVIVLFGDSEDESRLGQLYERDLSKLEFTVMMNLFKHGSKFSNANLSLQDVALTGKDVYKAEDIALYSKLYRVNTMVNGQPGQYESTIGKITQDNHLVALVFTFNAADYTSERPLQDLLKTLQPLAATNPKRISEN